MNKYIEKLGGYVPSTLEGTACPFCDSEVVKRDASFVYGENWKGKFNLYVCSSFPACRSWSGTHHNRKEPSLRDEPVGTLANEKLREKRIAAHNLVDPLWKSGIIRNRRYVYVLMQRVLKIPLELCHIGYLDEHQLETFTGYMRAWIRHKKGESK
jgi:hypothetical protein